MPSLAAWKGASSEQAGEEAASSISEGEMRREQRRVKCAGLGFLPERAKRSQ